MAAGAAATSGGSITAKNGQQEKDALRGTRSDLISSEGGYTRAFTLHSNGMHTTHTACPGHTHCTLRMHMHMHRRFLTPLLEHDVLFYCRSSRYFFRSEHPSLSPCLTAPWGPSGHGSQNPAANPAVTSQQQLRGARHARREVAGHRVRQVDSSAPCCRAAQEPCVACSSRSRNRGGRS